MTSRVRPLARCAIASAVLSWTCVSHAAGADAPAFCADPAYAAKPIPNDAFATEILIANQVSPVVQRRVDTWRSAHPEQSALPTEFTAAEVLVLFGDAACGSMGCTAAEKGNLQKSSLEYARLLKDTDNLSFTGSTIPTEFFTIHGGTVQCRKAASEKLAIVTSTPPPDHQDGTVEAKTYTAIRVRGTSDDLIYAGGSSAYSDASKAKISFEDDATSSKQSTKFVGALGYSLLFSGRPNRAATARFSWGLIPYVAFNIDTATTKDKPKSVSSNTVELGTQLQFLIDTVRDQTGLAVGQYVALTPKFLFNRDDKSRLLGLGGLWRPTLSLSPDAGINTFRALRGVPLKWELILDARAAYGHFTMVGTRTGDDARDFLRLGGRYGFGLSTTMKNYPVDLIVTDMRMFALSGATRDLDLFNTSLALFLDADKHFGVDLSYAKGRATDLEKPADKWSIGLAVRY